MFGRKEKKSLVADREFVDYKDVDLLQRLVAANGKMVSRRQLGCNSKMQYIIKRVVHRARFMGLIPYGQ